MEKTVATTKTWPKIMDIFGCVGWKCHSKSQCSPLAETRAKVDIPARSLTPLRKNSW